MTRSSAKSDDETGISTHSEPDYSSIQIPAKPPSEFSYAERRADLLAEIYSRGHPDLISQTRLAEERYEVDQSTVSRDIDALAAHIDDTLGEKRDLVTQSVYRKSITGLLEQEEYRKAAQTVGDWNDWLDSRQDLRELEERVAELEAGTRR